MARSNRTNHFLLTFDDGEVVAESARDTLGGWANMMARVEDRFGGQVRSADETGARWTVAGRTFTVEQFCKL